MDDKVSSKKRNNDNMNPLNHVAIIMDGNGRWGVNIKIQETYKAGLKTVEKIIRNNKSKYSVFNIIRFFNRKLKT